jgi:hypothetical protein
LLFAAGSFADAKKASGKKSVDTEAGDDDSEDDEEEDDDKEDPSPNPQDFGDDTEKLAETLSSMKIDKGSPSAFGLSQSFPFIQYSYADGNQKKISIDFLVHGAGKEFFRPKVVSDGTVLQLGVVVHPILFDRSRVELATTGLKKDTHKSIAFQGAAAKVTDAIEIGDHIIGAPQRVTLDFKCDEEITRWEIIGFESDDQDFTTAMGGSKQFQFILAVELTGATTVRREHKEGNVRHFTKVSPPQSNKRSNSGASGGSGGSDMSS